MSRYFKDDAGELAKKEEEIINTSYLLFKVSDKTFALPIINVNVIIQRPDLVSIPDMPPYISGLTNYLSKIYPVMDTRKRFYMNEVEYGERTPVILITSDENLNMGIIVDDIVDIKTVDENKILDVPEEKTGFFNRFVKGFFHIENDNLAYIIDCDALFVTEKEYIMEINELEPESVNGGKSDVEEDKQ